MSKGTTRRTVRIEDGLWESAKAVADANGENLSEVIRRALMEYMGVSEEAVERVARAMASEACSIFEDHADYWIPLAHTVIAAFKGGRDG